MHSADLWWWFWTICSLVSGGGFFLIALIVLVRGVGDLRQMIRTITSRTSSAPDS